MRYKYYNAMHNKSSPTPRSRGTYYFFFFMSSTGYIPQKMFTEPVTYNDTLSLLFALVAIYSKQMTSSFHFLHSIRARKFLIFSPYHSFLRIVISTPVLVEFLLHLHTLLLALIDRARCLEDPTAASFELTTPPAFLFKPCLVGLGNGAISECIGMTPCR